MKLLRCLQGNVGQRLDRGHDFIERSQAVDVPEYAVQHGVTPQIAQACMELGFVGAVGQKVRPHHGGGKVALGLLQQPCRQRGMGVAQSLRKARRANGPCQVRLKFVGFKQDAQ